MHSSIETSQCYSGDKVMRRVAAESIKYLEFCLEVCQKGKNIYCTVDLIEKKKETTKNLFSTSLCGGVRILMFFFFLIVESGPSTRVMSPEL